MNLSREDVLEYDNLIRGIIVFWNREKNNIIDDYRKILSEDKIKRIENLNLMRDMVVSGVSQDNLVLFEKGKFYLYLNTFKKKYEELKNRSLPNDSYFSLDVYTKYDNMEDSAFGDDDLTVLIIYKDMSLEDIVLGQFIAELFKSLVNIKSSKNLILDIKGKTYNIPLGTYLGYAVVEYFARNFFRRHKIKYLPNPKYQMYLQVVNELVNMGYKDKLFSLDIDSLNDDMIKEIEKREFEYFKDDVKRLSY